MKGLRGSRRYDALVVGAGPAGASCALRLAQYQSRVALFDKGDRTRQHVGESLPSSIHVVLETLGLELPREVVVARPPSHLVFWGAMSGEVPFGDVSERESSLLVWRGPLDSFLRDAAAARGVRVLDEAVRRVSRARDGVSVETVAGEELLAPLVVDATGRSGIVARSFRRKETRFRTLALTGHFDATDRSPTIVEAFDEGWVWSAPLSNALRDVTVMVDAPGKTGFDREALFESALEKSPHVRELVSATLPRGPVRGVDATPYDARVFSGPDFLLVGDAASFLDPLSAHGVHKAMDGALTAAVVARTMLERPAMAEDARAFYEDRERSIYGATRERLDALYARETRFPQSSFWRKRSAREPSPEPRAHPRPPFDGRSALAASREVLVAEAPVLEDDFIERREVLLAPGRERPVRFLGPVCLPDLYKDVVACGSALEAARRSPAGFERAVAAIGWLYREGYLERREPTEL